MTDTTVTLRVCLRCYRPMREHSDRGSTGERHHVAHGMCQTCYHAEWRAARRSGMETYHTWVEYADDYVILRAQGCPLDVIATRLGMTLDALDRALCRHRDDPRAKRPGGTP